MQSNDDLIDVKYKELEVKFCRFLLDLAIFVWMVLFVAPHVNSFAWATLKAFTGEVAVEAPAKGASHGK